MSFHAANFKGKKSRFLVIETPDPTIVLDAMTKEPLRVVARTAGKSNGTLGYADGSTRELRVDVFEVEKVKS